MEQTCKNCEKPLVEGAKYCAFCGEKTKSPKVTVKALMQKLWDTTFHIDNKLFRALKDAFRPGTMALQYFAGKRSRHPLQDRLGDGS